MVSRSLLVGLSITGLACAEKEPPATSSPAPAPIRDAAPVAIADAASTDPQVIAGLAVWGKYCALCHGPKARGYVADNAPSLVSSTFLATASDSFLHAGIARGRPGTAMAGYGKAVGGPLDDVQIAQLIAFIRNGDPGPRPLPDTPVVGNPARGAVVYKEKCLECHGSPEARGLAPHLANPVFLETASDAFIRNAVAFGRPETTMLAYAGAIPESDIDAVVAYVRSLAKPAAITSDPTAPTTPPKIVINPRGKAPSFRLREDRFVPAVQVKKALDQKRKMVIVDARAPSDWLRSHIPGSVSVPYYDVAAIATLPTDGTWIIAYCACPHHASGVVVDELRKRGVKTAAVLDEGVLVWQNLGFPVVTPDGKPAPPLQAAPPHDHSSHGHDHSSHGHSTPAPPVVQ
jgi:cytochrome c oxidase cbb3-type subunit 3